MSQSSDVVCLGHTLSAAERYGVDASLLSFSLSNSEEGLSTGKQWETHFWGKISGQNGDYLLLRSVAVGKTIDKRFHFSGDRGATFQTLVGTKGNAFVQQRAPKVRGPFTGNPSHKYREKKKRAQGEGAGNAEEGGDEEEGEEEEEEEGEIPEDEDDEAREERLAKSRQLTEIERLAWAVEAIDAACFLVPRGLFQLNCLGLIERNGAFAGLSPSATADKGSFLLFRSPQHADTLARVRAAGIENNPSFLDSIGQSDVEGEWAVQRDPTGLAVKVRSLLWPGYEFSWDAVKKTYQSAYFGTGEKNEDLMFMV